MGDYTSFYDVLGLRPDEATQATVETAYRERVKQYHPDVSDDPDQELLALVQTARDVIGDPDERARYDRLGHNKYVQLRLDGEYRVLEEDAPSQTPGPEDGFSSDRGQRSRGTHADEGAASSTDLGVATRERSDSQADAPVDAGEYSHDRAFDFLEEDRPEKPHNSPDHVADVFLQAWINRILVLGIVLLGVGGVIYGGGFGTDVLGLGVPTVLLLATGLGIPIVFAVSGRRRQRQLYQRAGDSHPISAPELRVGGVLVGCAVVSTFIGAGPPAATWRYARGLLLGMASGPSPWLTGGSTAGTVIDYVGAIAIASGALIGGSLLVAGVAHRAWHARYIDGSGVYPTVWEVAAVLPLVAIYWAAIFGETKVDVFGPVVGALPGPVIAQGGGASFLGLGVVGLVGLLAVAVGQDLRLRFAATD